MGVGVCLGSEYVIAANWGHMNVIIFHTTVDMQYALYEIYLFRDGDVLIFFLNKKKSDYFIFFPFPTTQHHYKSTRVVQHNA